MLPIPFKFLSNKGEEYSKLYTIGSNWKNVL